MKKLNQTGFSAVEALLVLILIAILGFTGFYVANARHNANKTLDAASKAAATQKIKVASSGSAKATTTTPVSDQTANWTAYNSLKGEFSVKYPNTWVQPTHQDLCGDFLARDLEIGPDAQSVIKCGGDGTNSQVSISSSDDASSVDGPFTADGYTQIQASDVTVNGVAGKKYQAVASGQEGKGLGAYADGVLIIHEEFIKSGTYYELAYTQNPVGHGPGLTQNLQSVFDQIVSTIRFH